MSNRAERRARAKSAGNGEGNEFARGGMKSRRGVVDETALQQKARRIANGESGDWKPTGYSGYDAAPWAKDASSFKKPRSVRQYFRILSWTLIVLSILAFFVSIWIPNVPMWAIIAISAVFIVGVLSLFFVGGSYKDNPKLDSYGTAV